MDDNLDQPSYNVKDFSTQFANACFPVWIVNTTVDIIYINGEGQNFLKTKGCQCDLKNVLSHEDIVDTIRGISCGENFRKRLLLGDDTHSELAFSPFCYNHKYMGAYVFCVAKNKPKNPMESMHNIRQELNSMKHVLASESLKNVMSDILSSVNVIATQMKKQGTQGVDTYLSSIVSDCYSVLRTSNNLQLFSHIAPPMFTMDFWDGVAELMEACRDILSKEHLKFSYSLPKTTIYVHCNFANVANVLMNVISNSYLHSEKHANVVVTGYEKDGLVYLEVQDDGPGISNEIRPHIFEPYVNSDREDECGLGIGLAVAYHLISQMDGDLCLLPTDYGTLIRLALPTKPNYYAPDSGLCSTNLQYVSDRYSTIYLGLHGVVPPPPL